MERTQGKGALAETLLGRWRRIYARGIRSIAVASGKGGTGKSVFAASLAACFAASRRVTLFDADLGVGNAHILQGVSPAYTAAHVATGLVELEDIAILAPTGVRVLPAGSGVAGLASLGREPLRRIVQGFEKLEASTDLLLVDAAAGISDQTILFLLAADLVLVVSSPDLTAMTDAYALVKVLHHRNPRASVHLVMNRVRRDAEGEAAAEKIRGVARRFLGKDLGFLGCIPEDPAVGESIAKKAPFVFTHPDAAASRALRALTERLEEFRAGQSGPGSFASRIREFFP